MRDMTKDQNERIKAARKKFLAARWEYKQTVSRIRKENKKGYVALDSAGEIPSSVISARTLWERFKNKIIGVWSRG